MPMCASLTRRRMCLACTPQRIYASWCARARACSATAAGARLGGPHAELHGRRERGGLRLHGGPVPGEAGIDPLRCRSVAALYLVRQADPSSGFGSGRSSTGGHRSVVLHIRCAVGPRAVSVGSAAGAPPHLCVWFTYMCSCLLLPSNKVSMPRGPGGLSPGDCAEGDGYCDANFVCGLGCPEVPPPLTQRISSPRCL